MPQRSIPRHTFPASSPFPLAVSSPYAFSGRKSIKRKTSYIQTGNLITRIIVAKISSYLFLANPWRNGKFPCQIWDSAYSEFSSKSKKSGVFSMSSKLTNSLTYSFQISANSNMYTLYIWDFRLVKEPQAWKNRSLSKFSSAYSGPRNILVPI